MMRPNHFVKRQSLRQVSRTLVFSKKAILVYIIKQKIPFPVKKEKKYNAKIRTMRTLFKNKNKIYKNKNKHR
jgi:hypothetical protein